ncbi:MAG TPA: hypothetical protein VK789_18530 [Bryobacteraceae bacterium]|nr:hypothetical protein [Bryobacteraceae bacterium]
MDCATCTDLRKDLDDSRRTYATILAVLVTSATSADAYELARFRAKAREAEMNFNRATEELKQHHLRDHAPAERVLTA